MVKKYKTKQELKWSQSPTSRLLEVPTVRL